jgi:hypothetical protein
MKLPAGHRLTTTTEVTLAVSADIAHWGLEAVDKATTGLRMRHTQRAADLAPGRTICFSFPQRMFEGQVGRHSFALPRKRIVAVEPTMERFG